MTQLKTYEPLPGTVAHPCTSLRRERDKLMEMYGKLLEYLENHQTPTIELLSLVVQDLKDYAKEFASPEAHQRVIDEWEAARKDGACR